MTQVASHSHPPSQDTETTPESEIPLKIAFDVRFWEMSGLGTYTREFLGAAARLGLPVEWTLIGPERLREQIDPNLLVVHWIDFDEPVYSPRSFLQYPDPGPVDLVHYPHYNMPRIRRKPALMNVFDLFHLFYGSRMKRIYQQMFLRRLRFSRARLLTSSSKTTQDLIAHGRIRPERIAQIPLGPGRSQPRSVPAQVPEILSLSDRPLPPPWMLVVGIDQPHKNFDFLLSALSLYFQRRPDAPALVLSGPSEEQCRARARTLPASVRGRVAFIPHSDAIRLEDLFAGACALIFPSLDEGFGLPPLEAMRRGIPVLCSRREPMLSLLGEAPMYFEPTESASLWRVLDRLLDLPHISETAIEKGLEVAASYSWEETARLTYMVYEEILERTKG